MFPVNYLRVMLMRVLLSFSFCGPVMGRRQHFAASEYEASLEHSSALLSIKRRSCIIFRYPRLGAVTLRVKQAMKHLMGKVCQPYVSCKGT